MVNIKNRKIIVTGGAGFIGSNLVESLCKDNKVFVIDTMYSGSPANLTEAMKTGNVTLINDSAKNIKNHKMDADLIFHLGMYSSSPMYKQHPNFVNEVIESAINILEYAKANKIDMVIASTSSLYNGITPPHSESMAPMVTDFYTEARFGVERLAELYHKLYGLNITALRFFSVYGKHEEAKKIYANLVSQFLWDMRKNESPVIYGDGKQRRDFVYVSDVVEALKLASSRKGFDIFNVGTGRNYSLNETVEKLNAALKKNIKPKYVPLPMTNYVMETKADTTKAEKVLGFKAKITLDEGIKQLTS